MNNEISNICSICICREYILGPLISVDMWPLEILEFKVCRVSVWCKGLCKGFCLRAEIVFPYFL